MPPAISRKEDRFQPYRSGYHEDAPALDGLCKEAYFGIGGESDSRNTWSESEILLIPLWRFVDASRDKPKRRPLLVLSLRLPRRRACAGWSM